jgi:hypothetical protein
MLIGVMTADLGGEVLVWVLVWVERWAERWLERCWCWWRGVGVGGEVLV